ncbi:unnamed protein product [Vicia faba]|uniref:Uncharacterized protein n=1 Tax=Vicia faba TaxID=3906 RepID=A0AAV0ZAL1_VICFA|nr:unnamed protein product [Vicia faba]
MDAAVREPDNALLVLGKVAPHVAVLFYGENMVMSGLVDCFKELEEGHHVLAVHKEEAAWRIEEEYREQLAGLTRKTESKEQKMTEQWTAKHLRLTKFLEQVGCRSRRAEQNGG